jgi:hypothetical protein
MDARTALLGQLIDHAPMFPPAQLALGDALADHEAARASDAAWLVNRFVVRASQLAVLPPDEPPRLSVVIDESAPVDDARVEAVELRLPPDLDGFVRAASEVYVEVPSGADLASLAARGLRAKIRCGGERLPTIEELAEFVRACRGLGLAFKATAGLHHAVRTEREHGFLNLLAAVVFGDEEAALEETDASAFGLDGESFRWRDQETTADEIATVRRELFVTIGSCSFFEPVDELRALGFL